MKFLKITSLIAVLSLVFVSGQAFGQNLKITGTAPQFTDGAATALNSLVNDEFQNLLDDINGELGNAKAKPTDLITAFGNSSVYSSAGASPRGYGGFDLFSFTVGPLVGLQLPYGPDEIADAISDPDEVLDKIKDDGDIKAGVNAQALSGQFMLNSSFLLKDLYLGLRFGYFSLSDDMLEGFEMDTLNIGLVANYQLINEKSLLGLVKWRGLTVGTGFIYQNSTITYGMKLDDPDPITSITESIYSADIRIRNPKAELSFDVTTFTIPIEISTALRLLWILNISAGAGVDLAFGSSELEVGAKGDIYLEETSGNLSGGIQPGNLKATGGGTAEPAFFHPKVTAGLGVCLGPVVVDVPFAYYFTEKGYSVGLTVGIIW